MQKSDGSKRHKALKALGAIGAGISYVLIQGGALAQGGCLCTTVVFPG